MIAYLGAVVVASVIGSAHCVGMCGPMAMIATGLKSSPSSRWERSFRLIGYHFGRATTYFVLGVAVGWLGTFFDRAAAVWGWIGAATWAAGVLMVLVGIRQLWQLRRVNVVANEHDFLTKWLLKRIGDLRRHTDRLPGPARAFTWGFATTWLPCGWLYTFALVAAGAGSIAGSVAVMTAFWIGTLPALSGVAWLWSSLTPRIQRWVPAAASILLIVFGSHVVLARSGTSMGDWLETQSRRLVSTVSPTDVEKAVEEPPPCCRP